MLCLSCREPGRRLCGRCESDVRRPGPATTPGGLVVRSWAVHEGTARRLVHRLKYEGVTAVVALVAPALAAMLPDSAEAVVPIPRVVLRRLRYGIDPAVALATQVAASAGLPMVKALEAPIWSPRRAGRARTDRGETPFDLRRLAPRPVIVDDVLTTGRTVDGASRLIGGAVGALTVTVSGE